MNKWKNTKDGKHLMEYVAEPEPTSNGLLMKKIYEGEYWIRKCVACGFTELEKIER